MGAHCTCSTEAQREEQVLHEQTFNTFPSSVQAESGDDLPLCPISGCSLAFLQDFGRSSRKKVSAEDYTMGGLCIQIIKPYTRYKDGKSCLTTEEPSEFLSYAEVGFREVLTDSRDRPAFADLANHFVSHAWRYAFTTLLNALSTWATQKGANQDQTYFWVDAFVVNQHIASDFPMEWWSTRFAQAVGDIGSTILVSEPWQDPIPLKRVWVIWEIFCTNQMGARFDIAMPEESMQDFRLALIRSFETVQTALSGVDVALSTAYHKSHQDMVHKEISQTIGFTKLNEMVQLRMNRWLIEAATKELRLMKQQATDWNDRVKLQDNLARMLRESGNLAGAEFYFKELLAEIEAKLGKDDVAALSCLNQLAVTLQKAKQIDEAVERQRDCLQRRTRILGENHEDTLQSTSNLAVLLSSQRPLTVETFEEARELYSRAVKGRETTIGADNPRTMYTLSNFAMFLSEAPKPSEALFLEADAAHARAVSKLSSALSQGHPLTLAALHNQSCCWLEQSRFQGKDSLEGPLVDKAVAQLKLVHKLRIEKLGKEHPDTEQTERKLQEISLSQKGQLRGSTDTSSFMEIFESHFDKMCTADHFRQARQKLMEFGEQAVFEELVKTGFVDRESGLITTGMQPFNFVARIINGDLTQRKCAEEQQYLGAFRQKFIIAHNKPECEDMWNSSDPSWLGKASMSKNHRFLILKDLQWENFNVLTLKKKDIKTLKEMKEAAMCWVSGMRGWSSPEHTGLYFVTYPLTSVHALHLHIVDLKCVGPSFARLQRKMLPIDDAIQVLEAD
eukprot:TRINITY_DN3461_c0_g1_i5.p1 TRINITY_DN3461_c0_g1~~TRINITY_DN3461_c0_g1_i5.p1  ORF type:complete len:789 (-),score=128.53 TRINITY_DN3461_c0_g1_i5:181-2547(-)